MIVVYTDFMVSLMRIIVSKKVFIVNYDKYINIMILTFWILWDSVEYVFLGSSLDGLILHGGLYCDLMTR